VTFLRDWPDAVLAAWIVAAVVAVAF